MRNATRRLLNFIRKRLSYSRYVKNYIFLSNVRSSIFISVIVILLELWMIASAVFRIATSDQTYTLAWIVEHLVSYFILLASASCLLAFCVNFLRGGGLDKRIGRAARIVFTIIALAFGIYISCASIDPSGQVFAFLTMEMFVLCIFTWHPVAFVAVLTTSFLVYMAARNTVQPITYSVKVNAFTSWLSLLVIGLNNHEQRRVEAEKDERLERLNEHLQDKSVIDELTGVPNLTFFNENADSILKDKDTDLQALRFVFMNVENFSSYNKKYGFQAGNEFLKKIANILSDEFKDSLLARFSDDYFVALCPAAGLEARLEAAKDRIKAEEESVRLGLKAGIYTPESRTVDPGLACDNARYACASTKKLYGKDTAVYDKKMADDFKLKQHIVNNIDIATERGYIELHYQPVVLAENNKLCGAEVLARWRDPEYGFLPPNKFVPILEDYHLIHKLDMYVMESVCRDLKKAYEQKIPIVPVSVNFSRLDFEMLDLVEEIGRILEKYGISKNDIHIEITESALSENDGKLEKAIGEFHQKGYSLWLDDFGSGYSGFNVLKDFSFDMMKIDMKFLSKFSENEKTRPILTSIIELAQKIGMQTLSEGVETEEMRDFLKSIGCERLQGYLFGKPMPKDEFKSKLNSGVYDTSALKWG